jgi:hypothetical protein
MSYEPPLSQEHRPARRPAAPDTPDLPADPSVRVDVERLMRMMVEVLDDRRPAQQLEPVAEPVVLRYLRATMHRLCLVGASGGAGYGRAKLLSVRVFQPHEQAAEVAAVWRLGGRPRAVAARFERGGGGVWRCCVIRVG